MRVLVVEDETILRERIKAALEAQGFVVDASGDGQDALWLGSEEAYDAAVLDLGLPGLDGISVLSRWRETGRGMPVLVLTARSRWADKVAGFGAGADDYLTKPFEMLELLARVEALLRRVPGESAPAFDADTYQFGPVRIDFRRAEVTRDGQPVDLSALEFRLLRYFIEHRGETLSRDELLNEVWGYNAFVSTRTVDVHVAWLRQKLELHPRHPKHILTVHGLGYKFVG